MTLRFTPRARDDLREIMDYIAKENAVGADRGVGRFLMRALSLPRGLIWEFATQEPRNCGAAEDANVWIVHIRHSARRPLDEQT
jgi:toxin ParE1/3/4